ncbi:tetraacyldisaccharide 4'-kinase [Chitinimonas sp. BJB300]|uniref:tetraacyldisaccharide 4'-kinase n=1 Tax=Chitinimonas sp. BJB300 TaxID=1559339 RepID=UPI000C0CC902|nr:tetraacyldisaccharide 4'-kinase [Chitinimonas sp. BJB300]PHV10704.1 tetraacyldisaccharide 4'-kinase [Chitinimonas sp. BJB300]TSJ89775.1 tetraacyldisaccharide 4'-kinase [Chitinimonas sp. BJB300]
MHTPAFWQNRFPATLLLPLSWLFGALAASRRTLFRLGWLHSERIAAPVVVVGNITVGGAGKTPTVLYLAQALRQSGLQAGIISRGYGSSVDGIAEVPPTGTANQFGDEPLLLARSSGCPVFVGRDRIAAGKALLAAYPATDLILCDDGLQHYRLERDIEIVVIDGQRGLQNGWRLPAGPLREPVSRLGTVDAIVFNGDVKQPLAIPHDKVPTFQMQLLPGQAYRLKAREECRPLASFAGQDLAALAGIGNPARFFETLHNAGLQAVKAYPFSDHHAYSATDLAQIKADIVFCTEKDAVKLAAILHDVNIWVVPVVAQVAPNLADWLIQQLNTASTRPRSQ